MIDNIRNFLILPPNPTYRQFRSIRRRWVIRVSRVSKRSGMSESAVRRYEKGETLPDDSVQAMHAALRHLVVRHALEVAFHMGQQGEVKGIMGLHLLEEPVRQFAREGRARRSPRAFEILRAGQQPVWERRAP